MGIWHNRLVDTRIVSIGRDFTLPSSFLSKKNIFNKYNTIALSLEPSTKNKFNDFYLGVKNSIYIAIDGTIDGYDNFEDFKNEIINLYITYGVDSLYKFNGRFSLIIYDRVREKTTLFRSFFTGNPLYFVIKNNLLSVSTNPVYILHRDDISDTLNSDEMNAMFSFAYNELKGNVFSELTLLGSGEIVTIEANKIEHIKRPIKEFFIPQFYGSESEIIDKYKSLAKREIKKNLSLDVKYGIMLSSGMDSSTIAVFAKQILQSRGDEFNAYSWTLPYNLNGDESANIKILAKALKIPLKLFTAEGFAPFDMHNESSTLLPDTPYMNPYRFLVNETYRQASNDGVDILLNGGYGDLLYFGRDNQLLDMVNDRKFKLFFHEIYTIIQDMGLYGIFKHSLAFRKLLIDKFPVFIINFLRKLNERNIQNIPKWLSKDAYKYRENILLKSSKDLKKDKYEKFKTAFMPYFLTTLSWERYMSGVHGVKRLDPFHSFELLNFTSGVPAYMTYRNGQTKYFAREAMRGLLPESIRLQGRVGNLSKFFINSYEKNRIHVRDRLLDNSIVWREYIDKSWMENKLKKDVEVSAEELALMRLCLDIEIWKKAIKPGGSLYETSQ